MLGINKLSSAKVSDGFRKATSGTKKIINAVKDKFFKKEPQRTFAHNVLAYYQNIQLPTQIDSKALPFLSSKMMDDVTNPNVVGSRVKFLKGRTVVDVTKKDGSFVRKIYNPRGNTVAKSVKISNGQEKSILPSNDDYIKESIISLGRGVKGSASSNGRFVIRNTEDAKRVQEKTWRVDVESLHNSIGQKVVKNETSHVKNFENGKHVSGKIVDQSSVYNIDKEIVYDIPGDRQAIYRKNQEEPVITGIFDNRILKK